MSKSLRSLLKSSDLSPAFIEKNFLLAKEGASDVSVGQLSKLPYHPDMYPCKKQRRQLQLCSNHHICSIRLGVLAQRFGHDYLSFFQCDQGHGLK